MVSGGAQQGGGTGDTTNSLQQLVPVRRDQYGRYLIPDPNTGKDRAWTRATTVSSTLSDKFGLQQWAQRMTALGLASRPDLLALVASCGPDDKQKLNKVVDDAKEAAAASSGANLGTALHQFTERLDRGEQVSAPAPWDADLAAYTATLEQAGVTIIRDYVENIVTLPKEGVAGTFDRLVDIDGLLTVSDLKTGSFLDWHEISIQLALYAHAATIYDPATNMHTPMPAVDQQRALVIHLPAGQAKCELWFVDIAQGWEAAQQALAVREWRTKKNLAAQVKLGAPRRLPEQPVGVEASLHAAQFAWLKTRVERIVNALGEAGEPLTQPWPITVPTFKHGGPTSLEQCDELALWCDLVDADLELPFPDTPPHHAAFHQYVDGMTKAEIVALAGTTNPGALRAADVARIVAGVSNTQTTTSREKRTA